MPSADRNTRTPLAANLPANACCLGPSPTTFADRTSTAPDAMQLWARTVICARPACIAMTLGVSIVCGMITRQGRPAAPTDQPAAKVAICGHGAALLLAAEGSLSAMVALALGISRFNAFNPISAGFALRDRAGSMLKLTLYRTGS